jgi:hypothetical protein
MGKWANQQKATQVAQIGRSQALAQGGAGYTGWEDSPDNAARLTVLTAES